LAPPHGGATRVTTTKKRGPGRGEPQRGDTLREKLRVSEGGINTLRDKNSPGRLSSGQDRATTCKKAVTESKGRDTTKTPPWGADTHSSHQPTSGWGEATGQPTRVATGTPNGCHTRQNGRTTKEAAEGRQKRATYSWKAPGAGTGTHEAARTPGNKS